MIIFALKNLISFFLRMILISFTLTKTWNPLNWVNIELQKLHDWLTANKLTLNAKKFSLSFFALSKNVHNPPRISIYDNETNKSVNLARKDCIKYLIDENLSWGKHIVTVATKISKTIGMPPKLRHFVPSSVLVNIYNAPITPYLTNIDNDKIMARLKNF